MNKFLTILVPVLTLTVLTACDEADYGDADERMFETDFDVDDGDEGDDLDLLPNDFPGDEMSEGGLEIDPPSPPVPELDVLDAPNLGDPIPPQVHDGENGENGFSPRHEKDWDDGEGGDPMFAEDYDAGPVSCEGASGNEYELGDVWEEDCNVCACTEQGLQCTQMECGASLGIDTPNACGEHDLGDKWLHEDGCNMCVCTAQGIACTTMSCEMEVD